MSKVVDTKFGWGIQGNYKNRGWEFIKVPDDIKDPGPLVFYSEESAKATLESSEEKGAPEDFQYRVQPLKEEDLK